ncbi:hypothetical protein [Tepidicaulis sp.]|uniref:hypothetical protein n=1 Tax=Tepidicaulis sp. TaxID=1920809 RepID=UPI003B59B40D
MAETAAPAGDARPETAGETGTPAAAADAQPQPAREAKTFWTLKYGDQIYGPYAHEAMEKYIGEGRIVAQSVIAPAGSEEWKFAKDVSAFAVHFGGAPAQPEAETGLQASTQPDRRANRRAADTGDDRPAYGPAKGQIDRRKRPESNNFVIIAEIKSHHGPELERALMSAGPAMKIASNAWVLSAKTSAPGLLNQLSQHIGRSDQLFISDATSDRIAWFNFGPEMDAKVRRVWRKPT